MPSIARTLEQMRSTPQSVKFNDLAKLCEHYFGPPRQHGGSHRVYRTPWQGDPRINIQNHHGMAKAYQVRQVVSAVDRITKDPQ